MPGESHAGPADRHFSEKAAMPRLNVLISGAGIAGCTLAYWLARHGHAATVVERSGAIRSSGAPVDIRGSTTHVMEEMGLVPQLQAASQRGGNKLPRQHRAEASPRRSRKLPAIHIDAPCRAAAR
jgi:2-polyprenyl-6-methoxyphenol hydroxylase-like FAD-dependent oxidoreductase